MKKIVRSVGLLAMMFWLSYSVLRLLGATAATQADRSASRHPGVGDVLAWLAIAVAAVYALHLIRPLLSRNCWKISAAVYLLGLLTMAFLISIPVLQARRLLDCAREIRPGQALSPDVLGTLRTLSPQKQEFTGNFERWSVAATNTVMARLRVSPPTYLVLSIDLHGSVVQSCWLSIYEVLPPPDHGLGIRTDIVSRQLPPYPASATVRKIVEKNSENQVVFIHNIVPVSRATTSQIEAAMAFNRWCLIRPGGCASVRQMAAPSAIQ